MIYEIEWGRQKNIMNLYKQPKKLKIDEQDGNYKIKLDGIIDIEKIDKNFNKIRIN